MSISNILSRLKSMDLLRNISTITIANVLNTAIPFLLLPVLTSYLSTAEYGELDIFYTTMSFLTPIIGLNFYSGITVFYYDKSVNNNKYIGTSLTISFLSTALVLLLCFFLLLISPDTIWKYHIILVVILALFKVVNETLSTFWLIKKKTFYFGLFKVIRTITEILLSLILVIVFLLGVLGRIWGIVLVSGMSSMFVMYFFLKHYNIKFIIDKELLGKGLRYSIPLIFHSIGGYILNISDRYFIAGMVSDSELGIYSVAYQIGMAFYIIQVSFNQAWVPNFMKKINEGNFDKLKMVKHTYLYAFISIIVFAVLWICIPLFYWFVNYKFHSGMNIVPWVLLGFLFNGFYFMIVNYLFALKKTTIIATTTIVVGIINLILNYYFIAFWGIKGAAISTAISFFLSFTFFWYLSNKYYPMPWFSKNIFKK